MRTTLDISDDLMARARRLAADSGRTLTAVVEDALRMMLAKRRPPQSPGRVRLTTIGRGGVQPGVDLDDSAALADLMDADDVPLRR